MSEDKISTNEAIDAALHLDGDPQNVKQFYADWAQKYNQDVNAAEYSGPVIAAKILNQHLSDKAAQILDAGCGTGLVGVELKALGYGHIDGFDLSSEMADLAIATGAYRRVADNIDMMRAHQDYPQREYDALLSIGVFTLGHVPPQALQVLVQLVRHNGLLVISTRSHYFEQTNYQQCVDTLLGSGQLSQLQVIWGAPYNHDGDAHYWVFKKLPE
ncbi:class I SAM-dependent methyltransferase [Gammaproteobacteria bacterium]|nr:class I SAM-dependent methyltransferase [Gammaproteobacteria bacterium]